MGIRAWVAGKSRVTFRRRMVLERAADDEARIRTEAERAQAELDALDGGAPPASTDARPARDEADPSSPRS